MKQCDACDDFMEMIDGYKSNERSVPQVSIAISLSHT